MDNIQILLYVVLPASSLLLLPFIRWIIMRFNEIDRLLQTKTTTQDVRQMIDDKYTPIKEDLRDIKDKIDKIFDRLLDQPKRD